ncbi:MAG: T9SS type A sorting domain-containing protein [Sphingobacteriales bacterium]|nr:MAG: T9SS type A sorting domain-containing protein [Sphingobacteriales bacterium]
MALRVFSFLLAFSLCFSFNSKAQLTGGNVFLKGNYVEAAIAPNGAFGSTINSATGFHPQTVLVSPTYDPATSTFLTRTLAIGFVADYDKDGWSTGSPAYYGDYFVSGLPQEGFSIQANSSVHSAWMSYYLTMSATGFSSTGMTGANSNYTKTGNVIETTWLGTKGNLDIKQVTRLNDTDLFITQYITLKNTGSTTIADVYYLRTLDPDNDYAITNNAKTINSIKYQLPNVGDRVLVTSRGGTYTDIYLGLGTKDCRAKAFRITNNPYPILASTPGGIYNNSTGMSISQSGTDTADVGVGIVFKLGNIAAGDSVTFSYAYILKEADLDRAINQTQPQLAYDGKNYSSGDTLKLCQNGSGAAVDILNGDFYSWSWSPSTGLSTTTGTHNVINLTSSTPVNYVLTGTSSSSTICASKTINIRVEPNIIPQPTPTVTSLSYCVGQAASPLTATGTSVRWYTSATGGTGVSSITPSTATAGTFTYYATQTIAGCESSRASITVTVHAAPSITKNPVNDTACVNTAATFSIAVSGGNLTYQWQEDLGTGFVNISNNAIFSGVNTATLTVNNVLLAYSGYLFRCVISGLCASATTPSASARLDVSYPPSITLNPANTIVCVGLNDTLRVTATGININYQWQLKNGGTYTNLANSTLYTGVNTPNLYITSATVAAAGDYRCIVSNECNPPDTSDVANVRISTIANIWRQPGDQYLCQGVPLDLDVQASGPITGFQWQMDNGTGWKNVINTSPYSGAKSNLLRISSVNANMDSVKFRLVVIGECLTIYSNEINIWLYDQPKIITQPVDAIVTNNKPAVFEVGSTGVGTNFRWQASFTGVSFAYINDNSIYNGSHTPKLTISHATYALNSTYYRCVLEETGGCNYSDTATDTVQLIVNPPTSVASINGDAQFIFYPNPVEGGQIFIQSSSSDNNEINLTITNSVGQKVVQLITQFQNNMTSVDVSSLAPGVYVIQLTNKEQNILEKSTITINNR